VANENGMFVRVVRGHAVEPTALRPHRHSWERHVAAASDGYLGATAGVTDDNTFIAMIRFTSEVAADRCTRTADHAVAWDDVLADIRDALVEDAHPTDIWSNGGADSAGFVQIRQGVSSDPDRLRDLYVNQQPVRMGPHRPEVLGGLFAWHGDARSTLSAYFTSVAAARSGEKLHEFTAFFDDISAVVHELTYYDVRDPWLSSPRSPAVCTAGSSPARS
jgi:hypothetical protein